MGTGKWVTKIQITRVKINQIRLREPLELQTIQPKKYLKCTNALGYEGHMLPILVSYSSQGKLLAFNLFASHTSLFEVMGRVGRAHSISQHEYN